MKWRATAKVFFRAKPIPTALGLKPDTFITLNLQHSEVCLHHDRTEVQTYWINAAVLEKLHQASQILHRLDCDGVASSRVVVTRESRIGTAFYGKCVSCARDQRLVNRPTTGGPGIVDLALRERQSVYCPPEEKLVVLAGYPKDCDGAGTLKCRGFVIIELNYRFGRLLWWPRNRIRLKGDRDFRSPVVEFHIYRFAAVPSLQRAPVIGSLVWQFVTVITVWLILNLPPKMPGN